MPDWTSHLTRAEAQAIVDAMDAPPEKRLPKTRYAARDDHGAPITRYVRPTAAEMTRIRAKAEDDQ